ADLLGALGKPLLLLANGGNARQIALDVGGKHRHAGIGKPLRQHLQRHGLAGARGTRHQAMPVGEFQLQVFGLDAAAEEYLSLRKQGLALYHDLLLDWPLRLICGRRSSQYMATRAWQWRVVYRSKNCWLLPRGSRTWSFINALLTGSAGPRPPAAPPANAHPAAPPPGDTPKPPRWRKGRRPPAPASANGPTAKPRWWPRIPCAMGVPFGT